MSLLTPKIPTRSKTLSLVAPPNLSGKAGVYRTKDDHSELYTQHYPDHHV